MMMSRLLTAHCSLVKICQSCRYDYDRRRLEAACQLNSRPDESGRCWCLLCEEEEEELMT